MINLIPKEEKKSMAKDFHYRIVFLFLLMLNFCILILAVSVLPSYFISSVKDSGVSTKLALQKGEKLPTVGEESISAVQDMNNKLGIVEKAEAGKFLLSDKVINAIVLKKRPDIKITEISYVNDPALGKKINISGTAPSREVLLLFRLELQDNPVFKNVDLPISNFVKGSNIQFSLSIIPA